MLLEIVRTPEGASPAWVRDAWLGVQFQPLKDHPVTLQTRSAGSTGGPLAQIIAATRGTPEIVERRGYPANARDLLGLLALHRQDAAEWYIDNAPQMLNPDQVFILEEACCRPVAEVSFPFAREPDPARDNR